MHCCNNTFVLYAHFPAMLRCTFVSVTKPTGVGRICNGMLLDCDVDDVENYDDDENMLLTEKIGVCVVRSCPGEQLLLSHSFTIHPTTASFQHHRHHHHHHHLKSNAIILLCENQPPCEHIKPDLCSVELPKGDHS